MKSRNIAERAALKSIQLSHADYVHCGTDLGKDDITRIQFEIQQPGTNKEINRYVGILYSNMDILFFLKQNNETLFPKFFYNLIILFTWFYNILKEKCMFTISFGAIFQISTEKP